MHLTRPLLASIAALALVAMPSVAQQTDAPAPDAAQLLQFLKTLKEQQVQQVRSQRLKILQEAQAAAASPSAAAAAWVEAVRLTQFEGAEKEGAQFRGWKDGDGAAFTDLEVQKATQLYFRWLALTIQRANGMTAKELLPAVIQFTKDVSLSQTTMQDFAERAAKDKELAQSKMHGNRKDSSREDERTKKMHQEVLTRSVLQAPPVKAMRGDDFVKVEKWELSPGNVDGIFNSIILPELRLARDPRVLEYWDMKIKKAAERVKDRPAFDQDKFNKDTYPSMLWSRAGEYVAIGQPNRGLAEMLKLLRAYPQHPDLAAWIKDVEVLLAPPTSSTPPAAPVGASANSQ